MRVAAAGGSPEVLTTPVAADGETDHFWPHLLPDGRHALFSIMRADRGLDIGLLSLESKTWTVLIKNGTFARYAPTGHVVFASAGVLKAVPFDPGSLQTRGEPVDVLQGLLIKESGAADFAFSSDGTLVYLAGAAQGIERKLAWRDPEGRETLLAVPPANFNEMKIAPNQRLAVAVVGQAATFELWLVDLAREVSSRLTAAEYRAQSPVWSPDSRWIAFWSPGRLGTAEPAGLFLVGAAGTGQPERLTSVPGPGRQLPSAFTSDGKLLLFGDGTVKGAIDINQIALESRKISPVLSGPDAESNGVVSPNGRWLAHGQVEARSQIFIRPYPNVNEARIPVATESSVMPEWSHDGRALYFFDRNMTALSVVDVKESGGTLTVSPPRRFVSLRDETNAFGNVALPPVNGRMLIAARQAGPARPPEYRVILNWFEELKGKMAGKQ
jgi:serine/threonine-protein kinase